jgi:1,4-dihydroxy-2-naphthoate octaprenyltransferase
MNLSSEKRSSLFSANQLTLFLAAIFLFFLGAGIARFLGEPFRVAEFWLGLLFVLLIFGSGFLLQLFFDPKRMSDATRSEEGLRRNRQLLLAGLSLFAAGGLTAYFIFMSPAGGLLVDLFLCFIFLATLLYAVPPFRLASRGYGELTMVLIIANIVPALAYVVQAGTLHNMLVLLSLPLNAFLLAMFISTNLNGYLNSMLSSEKNLVMMLGWKLAMDLHDWLIVGGYILFGLAYFRGLAWNLVWPTFIALPVFLITIFEIRRIKSGTKPRWTLLTFSGYAGTGLLLYTLLFTLWFR